MSGFNGSGTFNISGVGLPYVSGTTISSSVANTLNTQIAAGLSTCILKDGTQTLTANIPFSGYKITGLGVGTASTDASNVYNVQCSTGTLLTVSGTDTLVGSASPALPSSSGYVTGMTFRFFAAATNTGAVTLNIDTQGAKAITKNGTTALTAGDIPTGVLITVTYDGTRFVLANQTTFASLTTATLTVTSNAAVNGTLNVTGKTVFAGGNVLSGGNTLIGAIATADKTNNGVAFLQNQAAVSTTLSADITATALSIPLTSVVGFPTGGGTVLIDNEQITYASTAGNSLTVSSTANRGVNGTTAAAHSNTAAVSSATFGSTTLSGTLDATTPTITVAASGTNNFPNTGTLIIDGEQISYTGKTSNTFTGATRGANGTTAVAHLSGAVVTGVQNFTTSANLKYDDVTGALKVPNLAVTNLSISGASNITNAATFSPKIQPITATTAASALTVTLNPTVLDFRSTTLTSGAVTSVSVTSVISLTVASGATLGSVSSQAFRLVVLAINNSNTVELAIVNLAGGNQLDETNIISTTVLNTASDVANVIYSTTARTNVAYKVVGFIDFPAGTAGTWATITEVQGTGGQPLAALSSLGYGQKWTQLTTGTDIVNGTTYYNISGKPIAFAWNGTSNGGAGNISVTINSVTAQTTTAVSNMSTAQGFIIVPPGASYNFSWDAAINSLVFNKMS
jgi:hypothetical protein